MPKTKLLFIPTTLLAIIFVLYQSWSPTIVFSDELIYEDLAYYAYRTGDFITPHFRDQVWLEKPPLHIWLTAPLYYLFPPHPLIRRLPTLFSALGLFLVVYHFAKTLFSEKIAPFAPIILLTSHLFFRLTKSGNLDVPHTFLSSLSILFYVKSKTHPQLLYLAVIILSLDFLNRSFFALAPLVIIILDYLITRPPKPNLRTLFQSSLLLLSLTLPWHLYLFLQYPQQFTTQYLIFNTKYYLFQTTPGHLPPNFAETLKLFLYDLTPFFPLVFIAGLLRLKLLRPQPILLLWLLTPLLPLLASRTQHGWYFIQLLPPIALLASPLLYHPTRFLLTRLPPQTRLAFTSIFLSTIFALPLAYLLSYQPQDASNVSLVRYFLHLTPPNTPLYNFRFLNSPNTYLFNPRSTPIIDLDDFPSTPTPFYLISYQDQVFNQILSYQPETFRYTLLKEEAQTHLLLVESATASAHSK